MAPTLQEFTGFCLMNAAEHQVTRQPLNCTSWLSLSLSFPVGGGHRPNPFQVAPEASWIGCEGVSWPSVPPGVIMGRTLEHQMLDRLVGAVAVRADGRVPVGLCCGSNCRQLWCLHPLSPLLLLFTAIADTHFSVVVEFFEYLLYHAKYRHCLLVTVISISQSIRDFKVA